MSDTVSGIAALAVLPLLSSRSHFLASASARGSRDQGPDRWPRRRAPVTLPYRHRFVGWGHGLGDPGEGAADRAEDGQTCGGRHGQAG